MGILKRDAIRSGQALLEGLRHELVPLARATTMRCCA
jgi:hypothetical protein